MEDGMTWKEQNGFVSLGLFNKSPLRLLLAAPVVV